MLAVAWSSVFAQMPDSEFDYIGGAIREVRENGQTVFYRFPTPPPPAACVPQDPMVFVSTMMDQAAVVFVILPSELVEQVVGFEVEMKPGSAPPHSRTHHLEPAGLPLVGFGFWPVAGEHEVKLFSLGLNACPLPALAFGISGGLAGTDIYVSRDLWKEDLV